MTIIIVFYIIAIIKINISLLTTTYPIVMQFYMVIQVNGRFQALSEVLNLGVRNVSVKLDAMVLF